MNKLIENYNNAEEALFEHVGFNPDWVVYPIDDNTDKYWYCDGKIVKFANDMEQFNSDGDYYEDDVYEQRFYGKYIYEGKDLTMIFCDPHTDGMKWFRIFDNSKRVK